MDAEVLLNDFMYVFLHFILVISFYYRLISSSFILQIIFHLISHPPFTSFNFYITRDFKFKVIVVGDSGAGKTSLLLRHKVFKHSSSISPSPLLVTLPHPLSSSSRLSSRFSPSPSPPSPLIFVSDQSVLIIESHLPSQRISLP